MSRGGGRPVTGRVYRATDDGDLELIAQEVYGDSSKASLIWGANPGRSSRTVKKGERLVIPGEPPPSTLTGRAPDEMTVVVGGIQIPVESGRILRTMDTGADGWSVTTPWTPGASREFDRVTRPYGYERAAAYIGNELQVGGCLYVTEPEMTSQGLVKGLTGYSFTADAIDSTVMPPYERNGVTLKQLAGDLLGPIGITAEFQADFGGRFDRVTADEGEKIFDFLARLAAQRGGLVSCTPEGNALFWRARTDQPPVGALTEGGPPSVGWKASYDGRKRYHAYRCVTHGIKGRHKTVAIWGAAQPTPGAKIKPPTAVSFDDGVPRSRWLTFKADDVTEGNVKNAANWRRNRHFIDALTLPHQVCTWYAPNGKPWEVNTRVVVTSRVLGVSKGFTFLIRAVEFTIDRQGRAATLYLVPPQAYSGKDIGDIWTYE